MEQWNKNEFNEISEKSGVLKQEDYLKTQLLIPYGKAGWVRFGKDKLIKCIEPKYVISYHNQNGHQN